eukprot:scaffold108432_cov72-Cyclotella_meneghiniana.AAC.4
MHLPLLTFLLLPLLVATSTIPTNAQKDYDAKIAAALKYYADNIGAVTASSLALLESNGEADLDFASMANRNELLRLDLLKYHLGVDELEDGEEEGDEGSAVDPLDTEDIEREAMIKSGLNPEEWFRFTYWELHAYFSCAAEFVKSKPIPSPERWADLRDYYHTFVKQDLEDWPLQENEGKRSYIWTDEGFDPPMEPFQSGFKGRGLKSNRLIKTGELVFRGTNNTIIFTHGHTWRKFLFSLYERHGEEEDQVDSETTCDVLVWSWVQQLVPDGPLVIVMDLDNGSLMNEGRLDKGWEDPNVKCGKEDWCDFEYYAVKDIQEGEEILCDYREFAMLNAWTDMGL